MSRSLASVPEELLVRILALALAPAPAPAPAPPRPGAPDVFSPIPNRNRIAPLLVSRQFLRIASPFFYHTIHLHSTHQAARVLDTLTHRPALANAVRRLVFGGVWHGCAGVLALCNYVQDIDICLDEGPAGPGDVDAEAFCHALEQRRTITQLTIRKNHAVYLTHPRPVYVLQRLAQAVHQWTDLETVHFALRVSSSPSTLPLARALSVAPGLRSVRTQLPAVWNNLLLIISTNPRLDKVMLYTELTSGWPPSRPNPAAGSAVIKGSYIGDETEHAVLGTGLYMMEAKKHARLSELIKCGTSIIRTRAHTTIATLSTPSAGGTPLGAMRAKEVGVDLMTNHEGLGLVGALPFAASRHLHARDI